MRWFVRPIVASSALTLFGLMYSHNRYVKETQELRRRPPVIYVAEKCALDGPLIEQTGSLLQLHIKFRRVGDIYSVSFRAASTKRSRGQFALHTLRKLVACDEKQQGIHVDIDSPEGFDGHVVLTQASDTMLRVSLDDLPPLELVEFSARICIEADEKDGPPLSNDISIESGPLERRSWPEIADAITQEKASFLEWLLQ